MVNYKTEIKRINGYLKEVVTILDDSGNIIGHSLNPLMVELKPRDILQLFVGSFLISTPLCFTEEVWKITETLPRINLIYFLISSLFAVIGFVYFNFYRFKMKGHIIEFTKRIFFTYFISLLSTIMTLFFINKLPLGEDIFISVNRVVVIGFPSVFGAIVTDYLK